MPTGYEGFGAIGQALAGGDRAANQAAFQQGATQAAGLESSLMRARKQREEAMAMDKFKNDPNVSDEVKNMVLGGLATDFSAAQLGIGRGQQNLARGRALDQPLPGQSGYDANTPDIVNQMLAVASDKLMGPSNVQVRNQAQAKIGEAETRMDANTARAENSRASANTQGKRGDAIDAKAAGEAIVSALGLDMAGAGDDALTPAEKKDVAGAATGGKFGVTRTNGKKPKKDKAGKPPADAMGDALGDDKAGAIPGFDGFGADEEKAAKRAKYKVTLKDGTKAVRVDSPEAAKAAWEKLPKGAALVFPSGKIKRKE